MPSTLYRADPPAFRRTVPMDGMTLIFHVPSGMTHVVASPVPEILELLSDSPADVEELLRRLADAHDLEADGAAAEVIAARLVELEAAGLVRRA